MNQRTCTQLKSLWKIKSRTHFDVAKDPREKAKTCGGPQAVTGLNSLQSAISSVLPQIHIIGNKFDHDAVLYGD